MFDVKGVMKKFAVPNKASWLIVITLLGINNGSTYLVTKISILSYLRVYLTIFSKLKK